MRHEKELVARPIPPCPDIEQRPKKQIDQYKKEDYIRFSAEAVQFPGETALAVTTFSKAGAAEYRFFLLGDQYGMQVFKTELYGYKKVRQSDTIYRTAIDSVYQGLDKRWWYSDIQKMYSTPDNVATVMDYLGKNSGDGGAMELFAAREREIREAKIQARDDKKRGKLRAAFEGVDREIPKEFKEWVERVPLSRCRYFFYDYTGKKEQSGICSYCEKISVLPNIKEFEHGTCPNCGTEFKFYSAKRLWRSRGIVHRGRAAFFQPVNENRIALRCCSIGISLRGGQNGTLQKTIWADEDIRFFMDAGGKVIERYATPEGPRNVLVDGLTELYSSVALRPHTIAPLNLENLRKKFGIYAPLEVLAEHGLHASPDNLFRIAKDNRQIEYLIKLGLYKLADNEFEDSFYRTGHVLKKGKTAAEVLGVAPDVLPILRQADPSAKAFVLMRSLYKCGVKFTVQDMMDITALQISYRYSTQFFQLIDSCSVHKTLKYIREQAAIYGSDGDHVLQEWGDHIGMAEALKMNLSDHAVWMPKNLKRVHAEDVKIQEAKKNEVLNKRMASTAAKLKDLCWEFKGLTIRPAVSHDELFQEGKALSHCVGRIQYAEKQAHGQTAIFFIRKSKTPDESYVTLELDLREWEKIQCYGVRDSYPGKKVSDFVNQWIREIVKPARAGNVKAAVQVAV